MRRGDGGTVASDAVAVERRLDLTKTVQLHGSALLRRALWLTKTESDAADLFQETVERALRGKRVGIDEERALRWLLAIMYNAFLDHCRAKSVRRTVNNSGRVLEQMVQPELAEPPLWRTVDDELLYACIGRLSFRQQEILGMHLQGRCYRTISQCLGLPANTVGTRLFRARSHLRRLLLVALTEQGRAVGQNLQPMGEREMAMSSTHRVTLPAVG